MQTPEAHGSRKSTPLEFQHPLFPGLGLVQVSQRVVRRDTRPGIVVRAVSELLYPRGSGSAASTGRQRERLPPLRSQTSAAEANQRRLRKRGPEETVPRPEMNFGGGTKRSKSGRSSRIAAALVSRGRKPAVKWENNRAAQRRHRLRHSL